MNKNHRHYNIAKAWLEGAEIECRCQTGGDWHINKSPSWAEDWEYRVKPEPQWYDNIPEQGVLCWVSAHDKKDKDTIRLILGYLPSDTDPVFKGEVLLWKYATPVTFEEIKQFLPAEEPKPLSELQRKLAILEDFKQKHCPHWEADWSDIIQEKWFVVYSHYFKQWTLDCLTRCESPTTVYFDKPTAELLAAKLNSGKIKL